MSTRIRTPEEDRLLTWHLTADVVPDPPHSPDITYCDVLRWLIAVMDRDDAGLIEFCASVLAQGLRRGRLTEAQERAVDRVLWNVWQRYRAGVLECQLYAAPGRLVDVEDVEGSA